MHRPSSWGVIIASLYLVMLGCSRKDSAQETSPVAAPSGSAVANAVGILAASAFHDPAHPPIDCPLRKHGIDATHLRPFEEASQYI